MTSLRPFLAATAALLCTASTGAEWPQLRGPDRNGSSVEKLPAAISKDGAPVLWKARVGAGFSGPVAARGKALLFHREGSSEVLQAFDAATGKSLWRTELPATYVDDFGFDEGPRATPTIAGDRVFVLGADGRLACLGLADGKTQWQFEARKELDAGKGYFGFACSPIAHGSLVVANLGGPADAGIVAFEQATGKIAWKATRHEASYSSPVAARLAGAERLLFFTREGLVGLDPADGKVAFEHPWRARIAASVNAAMPLVVGNQVFLTASYNTGGIALRLRPDGAARVWANDESLSSQFASPVQHGGFLYGFHGRLDGGKPEFRCVDLKDGRVLWSEDRLGPGSVLLVGGELVLLLESGELLVAPPSPKSFAARARFQAVGNGARAHPAFADGRLYARDKQQFICLDFAR